MSYEGFSQNICNNGHRYNLPVHADNDTCPHPNCHEGSAFSNPVDETNGESVGQIPNHIWERFKIQEEVTQVCSLGHKHVTSPARYRIPNETEHRISRHYWDELACDWLPLAGE